MAQNRKRVIVLGGGPAGAAAAFAACSEGADVHIFEKSRSPRHKVCGEFVSAEACGILRDLGVWENFRRLNPPPLRRVILRFGSHVKEWTLTEGAFGLSRLELDRMLLDHAASAGAKVFRGERVQVSGAESGTTLIVAAGRPGRAPKGGRLFGFKSHFEGPTSDAVEMFFGRYSYIGFSAVENGITNVCGIAPEEALQRFDFQFDDFLYARPVVAERLRSLSRRMPWLAAGPLVFSARAWENPAPEVYSAGDALSFVDPFTGSGILNALLTGRMAGTAVAHGIASDEYTRACRARLDRPFAVSAAFRKLLTWGCAGYLASIVPGEWMYRFTRTGISYT